MTDAKLNTFMEPATLEDAETLRVQLTNEVQGIQAQLGDKQRTNEDGKRLTSKEYWAWKKRAQHALNQKLDSLRAVKAWIREQRRVDTEAATHLRNLCCVLDSLKLDEVDFDPTELRHIDAAKAYLLRIGTPAQTTAA